MKIYNWKFSIAPAALLLVALLARSAAAQSYWELSPYKIRVLVAVEDAAEFDARFQHDLLAALATRASVGPGAKWDARLELAPPPLRHRMVRSLAAVPTETFHDDLEKCDKIVLLAVAASAGHYRVAARELDCPTRQWSLTRSRRARRRGQVADAAWRAWREAFAPLARVSGVEGDLAALRLRAAGLRAADPNWKQVALGDVFLPIARRNARDGTPRPDGIRPIAWTLLAAGEIGDNGVRCRVYSGLRNPLAARRRGRVELYALAVESGGAATTLRLRARTDETKPLAGYEVYAQSAAGGEMIRLGLTDRAGEVEIEPKGGAPRVLYVKHGRRPLARLPMLPGRVPVETAALLDDDARLRVEAQLMGWEEALIDVVARREIYLARIRARLAEGDADGAAELLDELRRLPSREEFALRVARLQQATVSDDPAIQAELDRLFQRAKTLLGEHLGSRKISEMQTRVNRAMKAKSGERRAESQATLSR